MEKKMIDEYSFICIDKRGIQPQTKMLVVQLDNGQEHYLPPNIDRVPALLLVNDKHQVKYGEEIIEYCSPKNEEKGPNRGDYAGGGGTPFNSPFGGSSFGGSSFGGSPFI